MNILGRSAELIAKLRERTEDAAGPRRHTFRAFLVGGVLGGAAAYLLDPARGRARRVRLADQTVAALRRATHRAGQLGRLQAGRIAGIASEVRHAADRRERLNDASLAEKVETMLFRSRKVPKGSININVEDGVVVLRGEVADAALRERLEKRALEVSGVTGVRNLLHLPQEAAIAGR